MELTLKTFLSFLTPFLEAYELNPEDIFSITVEPGGIEVVTYQLDPDGSKKYLGNSAVMGSTYYPYLGSE